MTVPRSTLRLQFHRGFTFDDAAKHVDYFAALGISHVYASPITTAEPGSMHGYDTVDYTQVSAECGGEAGLKRLVEKLHAHGMGLIVDMVPNHMGVGGSSNAWWLDILEWGRHSAYARHFDVDWHSPDPALRGKVLLPTLGAPYGDELLSGRIALHFAADSGRFYVGYGPHVFPVCPVDYASILNSADRADLSALAERFQGLTTQPPDQPRAAESREMLREFVAQNGTSAIEFVLQSYAPGDPLTRDRLHRLLERQHFRLAWWRTAADEVNWRRFFDISTLAAVRAERPEVFEATHALIFRLYQEGVIDGLRIDHVDGLAEPREYCQRLRQRLSELRETTPYVIVEKILARGEPLRDDWPVDGTTGYDFMNDVGALLHDPAGAEPLAQAWAELTGRSPDFADEALAARRKIVAENLSAELDRAARALHRIARDSLATRDYTFTSLRRVLTELVVHFPVYRIYPQNGLRSAADNVYFEQALAGARATLSRADHGVLDRVNTWLGASADDSPGARPAQPQQGQNGAPPSHVSSARRTAQTLFSQLTAPVAAKAVEDTACYRYGRLLSRNEVGADPGEFALSVEQFHAGNVERSQRFPHAMLSTATHDHKRGEDVRARLAVLSEIPHEWSATLRAWSTLNAPQRRSLDGKPISSVSQDTSYDWAPGPAAEAMLYQTLVGCWPPELQPDDEAGVKALAERVAQWQLKALREAKLQTNWFTPDEAYEAGCRDFLFDILAPQRRDGFLRELAAFVARIARAGALNSLQQTVLRLASPGIPDLYQGTELWDFSLVDPDNRRPVDFEQRAALLAQTPPSEFLPTWRDGRVKLAVVQRVLALRAHLPELLCQGTYLPLTIRGAHASNVIAFARRHGNAWAVVVSSRLAAGLLGEQGDLPMVAPEAWQDTAVEMPTDLSSRALFDWLSPAAPKVDENGSLYLRDALAAMPIAVLVEDGVPRS
ncbi:malto-oligosyltrehalose synthase [Paraburkholderia phenoliruptrix]|uniref:malto-oligosyltrehalose synthase n=1 Tax=Paraburkholderia phenoliruptrix TaxID=252970 RepID=UPI001C6E6C03|nr:malto-oligosyltrehalose synthase [Paraburkholderia phenoliruptrix]MBW9106285.1 malto-oligosyltrehalose synthase [Paraburkholderia phenoliruptrix]MBW9129358.1 malto-oligosyltrehalose synthase [Paraburkholderia ginsengiterrae]